MIEDFKLKTEEEIEKELINTTEILDKFTLNQLHINRKISSLSNTVEKIKIENMAEIAFERDSDGKKRYPNEDSRNSECTRRINIIPAYKSCIQKLEELRTEKEEVDLEIHNKYRYWKTLRAIIQLRKGGN